MTLAALQPSMLELIQEYLRCSTGNIFITSLDNAETVASIAERYSDRPLVQWDIARGMIGLNSAGQKAIQALMPPADEITGQAPNPKALTTNPVDALGLADRLPRGTLSFWLNLQLYLPSEAVQQAYWNLRDSNKASLRCAIGVGPAVDMPPTLAQDVVILDEPAPTSAVLETLVETNRASFNKSQKQKGGGEIAKYDPAVRARAADAVLGLSAFAADQAIAVNTTSSGINIPGLWNAKIAKIGQIKGMGIHRGGETFAGYIGNDYAKYVITRIINGRMGIKGLWLFDEIDKDFAGNVGDNTGVSQELHGKLLQLIQDLDIPCILLAGVWGSGKTELIKCARNAAEGGEIAMMKASLSEMKSGVVGSTMTAFLTAWKTGMALSGNRPLLAFTCNSLKPLSPEFMSRMMVRLFFEVPDAANVAGLWKTFMRSYELRNQELPDSTGWVGREVRACCRLASQLEIPLIEAAKSIVPQTIASRVKLNAMRLEASGALIDAITGGPYIWKDQPELPPGRERAFDN